MKQAPIKETTMSVDHDRTLREAIRSAHVEAHRAAPSFPSLWTAARERAAHRPSRTHYRLAWTGATVILLGLALTIPVRRSSLPSDRDALIMAKNLAAWTAPSDELLATNAGGLPSGLPSLSIQSIELPAGHPRLRSGSSHALEIER